MSMDIKGKDIRKKVTRLIPAKDIPALRSWCQNIKVDDINWNLVFQTMYWTYTNNLKLVQFQYKLLLRISTCRYMRYKMKIEQVSENCYNCNVVAETLPHIFLECPISKLFIAQVERTIVENIDSTYNDDSRIYYLTCSHTNPSINFIWVAAKYYISLTFQKQKTFNWSAFVNLTRSLLVGEKPEIVSTINNIWP